MAHPNSLLAADHIEWWEGTAGLDLEEGTGLVEGTGPGRILSLEGY